MKRITQVLVFLAFTLPTISSAAALTPQQSSSLIAVVQSSPGTPASAFVSLITAFSNITVTQATSLITVIQAAPGVPATAFVDLLTSFTVDTVPVQPTPPAPHVPVIGSAYPSSNIGFDLSYNALSYPSDRFSFGIVGISGGKAFVHNNRLASEYSWTQFGTIAPTVYMNLNAPYGSTVAGNIASPKSCPARAATSTEPTACEGYNYGYNAAKDAYSYANSAGVSSKLWWLDIEEANSWSPDTLVNDATIQGAIDYLNTQGTRAGIYSVAGMWRDIAGSSFVPTQTIGGQTVSLPTWMPIGISDLVSAINICATGTSFVAGSPIWLVQYVANSTAVDQNVAC